MRGNGGAGVVFCTLFVSPARTERLNVDSLDGETAAEVWGRGVTSGGERQEAPLLIDQQDKEL